MEELLPFIIFIGWVIYNVISVAVSGKKNKKNRQVPGQPQQRPTQQSQPADQKQPQSIEDVFKKILQQQGQRSAENQAPQSHPHEKSIEEQYPHAKVESLEKIPQKKVFSYDDEYETEKYDQDKVKRHEHIRKTRVDGKHLQSSIHDTNLKLKKKNKMKKQKSFIEKDFKFNAKDAVIYDVILNRKYKL